MRMHTLNTKLKLPKLLRPPKGLNGQIRRPASGWHSANAMFHCSAAAVLPIDDDTLTSHLSFINPHSPPKASPYEVSAKPILIMPPSPSSEKTR